MIKEKKSLAMYEVQEILEKTTETDKTKDIQNFIKKFSNLDAEKSKKLKEAIEKLEIIKLRENEILKIVDIVPENAAELNKIVIEASLDSEETSKILDAIKKNK